MKSRIPKPMDDTALSRYRWMTQLPIPAVVPLQTDHTLPIYIGTGVHTFAAAVPADPAQNLPELPPIKQVVWGYGLTPQAITSPGPTLAATANQTTRIQWINTFGPDAEFPFVEPPPDLRAGGMMHGRYTNGHHVVHLHGAHVPWESDGHPVREKDPRFTEQAVIRPGKSKTCTYPNTQPGGATLWYHDHTMDMTARNVYAGMAGGYLLRHPNESHLLDKIISEIPLIIQDRSFSKDQETGEYKLFYGDAKYLSQRTAPDISHKKSRHLNRNTPPSPEFKGQIICVNGAIQPKISDMQRGMYRFRILNGCNSRILALRVSTGDSTCNTANLRPDSAFNYFWQIGSDGGFFINSTLLDGTYTDDGATGIIRGRPNNLLVLAPGERADVIIDFSQCAGDIFYITNHADGSSLGSGNKGDQSHGNININHVLQINLAGEVRAAITQDQLNSMLGQFKSSHLPQTPQILALRNISEINIFPNRSRSYLLEESATPSFTQHALNDSNPIIKQPNLSWTGITIRLMDDHPIINHNITGIPLLWAGQTPQAPVGGIPNGGPALDIQDMVTSIKHLQLSDDIHVWDIYNSSPDTHPVHLHLVQFQVIGRCDLDAGYNPINLIQPGFLNAPDKTEAGWKDTVRVDRHEELVGTELVSYPSLTRIAIKFSNHGDAQHQYTGTYVMHCHLIEHEDMGMMRPLVIHPSPPGAAVQAA